MVKRVIYILNPAETYIQSEAVASETWNLDFPQELWAANGDYEMNLLNNFS